MGGSSPRISRTTLPTVARRDKDRRRGRRRPAAPWAALILVVGVNCALYSLLQSKKEAARLDASLDATVAWRERALAAEETVAALAERLGAPAPPPPAPRPRPPPIAHQPVHKEEPVSDALPPFYGEGVKMVGLDTCDAYRTQQKPHMRRWAPAGMFNTGTNTLLDLMHMNCQFPDRTGRHGFWQVPWGKHNPLSWRGGHWAPQFQGERRFRPDPLSILPVVVVKDPTTWMKSMCRNQYECRFRHRPSHRSAACPSPVKETQTTMRYQPTKPSFYDSLPHFWRAWNGEYLNSTAPRLLIRFEDLLWNSEETIRKVCACVGGRPLRRFSQAHGVSKDARLGHVGPVNDRAKALRLYGSEAERFRHYTREDLEYVRDVAGASPLFRALGYDFDVDDALRVGASRRRLRFGGNLSRF